MVVLQLFWRNMDSDVEDTNEDKNQKTQDVISLLMQKSEAMADENSDLPSSAVAVTVSSLCHVSLADAHLLLESGLDNGSSVQLEDGTTAFVQSFDEVDSVTKFVDGQAVQLEDGTTAFLHASHREGLQPVQLEDGTMAYLSAAGSELFNGEAASLDLDQLEASQVELKEFDAKVVSLSRAEKSFECPECNRTYTTLHHLKVHERSHTGERPFKCIMEGCGKAFATGYGLKSHIRVHTGETPYKCSECQKQFKTSGDLQKHLRTHTGERPFKCGFVGCDRAFTTSNIRKVHMRTHTGERPYMCTEENCGRAFASATNFKNHMRIHTGEKPYLCAVAGCKKRFTEYSSLYKHNVVHTHAKPYSCGLCGKNYRQTSTLALHRRTTHGLEDECVNLKDDIDMKETESMTTTSSKTNESSSHVLSVNKNGPTIVTLQGQNLIPDQPMYAVQLQEDGTLAGTMQPIVLVTDPAHLAALQQLTQQDKS